MAKVTKYTALVGGNYARPGRPRTGPGSTDEIRFEKGDILELPDDAVKSYMAMGGVLEVYSGDADASAGTVVAVDRNSSGGVTMTPKDATA